MRAYSVSDKQVEYLAKVASGKRIQDIASEGFSHPQTVRYQLEGLKVSLGASTLPNLVAKGVSTGLILSDGEGGFRPAADGKPHPRGR